MLLVDTHGMLQSAAISLDILQLFRLVMTLTNGAVLTPYKTTGSWVR